MAPFVQVLVDGHAQGFLKLVDDGAAVTLDAAADHRLHGVDVGFDDL